MLGGSMDFYGQMPSAYDWASFEFLAHENYSSWKSFMHKLLYFYGQEHLDIVLGKHTRLDAEDKDKFDAVDEIALSTIRLAIDKEIHPWVLDVFSSSKELWDSLQFKFEIDAVMADMRDDTEIVQEGVLGTLCHGDYKTEEEQAARIKHEHTMSNEDNVHDISPSSMIQTSFDIADYAVTEMFSESSPLYIAPVPALQGALIQDICNEIEDKHMVVSCEWSASDALTSLCLLEDHVQQGQNNSYMETVAPTDLEQDQDVIVESEQDDLHVACLYEHRDEIFEHQAYTAYFKDELVLQLPWMDIYEQNAGFSSIITKVSKHEVDFPFYIHLHIPFACTHDGKVEDHCNLDDCLGYISYPGIGGFINRLKVNYRCLHVIDIYDHTSQSAESLPAQFVVDLNDAAMIGRWLLLSDEIYEFYCGTTSYFVRKGYAFQRIHIADMSNKFHESSYEQELFFKSYISSSNIYITKAREWYRGSKIWFRNMVSQPWLIWWLSLLYLMSTA